MNQVTERTGSPHTLVCSKTRKRFEQLYQRYSQDSYALQALAILPGTAQAGFAELLKSIEAARIRQFAH